MRSVSSSALESVRAGLNRLRPWLARMGAAGHAAGRRLGSVDLVPGLITAADRGERCGRAMWRGLRLLVPRRWLSLPRAMLWRGLAVLVGLGLTAALVTGLSAKDEDLPQLASLTSVPASGPVSGLAARSDGLDGTGWNPIARPTPIFALGAPELAGATPAYEARRSGDGRREDVMTFSAFADKDPHLLLRLRTGALDPAARSFTVDLVREAALQALSLTRSSAPAAMPTRFGSLETADVVLDDGRTSRSCLAFRSTGEAAAFAMSGWWCAVANPGDRRQLACLIDRLDLVDAAGNEALRQTFAGSERAPAPACEKQHLAGAGRNPSGPAGGGSVQASRMKTAAAEQPMVTPPARPVRPRPAHRKP